MAYKCYDYFVTLDIEQLQINLHQFETYESMNKLSMKSHSSSNLYLDIDRAQSVSSSFYFDEIQQQLELNNLLYALSLQESSGLQIVLFSEKKYFLFQNFDIGLI